MKRGDIYLVSLDPTLGHEQQGSRPVVVISATEFNQATKLPVVCPITSRIRPFGSSVVLPAGSPIEGEILVAQMRTLDTLARPLRFSGMKIDLTLLSAVRRKIAFLCGVSANDLAAA